MNYWQNYPKFFVSLHEGLVRATPRPRRTTGASTSCPRSTRRYDILQVFELMYQGKMNGYICQGFNPLASFPNKAKLDRGAVQAEVPGHHRPAGHRDLRVLEEPRRVQRRRSGQDPDRGLPAPLHLLRRGGRLAGQQRPLAAVALEGRRAARRGQGRPGDHRRALPARCASCTRRRAAPSPTRS